jgi:hypothetical protein
MIKKIKGVFTCTDCGYTWILMNPKDTVSVLLLHDAEIPEKCQCEEAITSPEVVLETIIKENLLEVLEVITEPITVIKDLGKFNLGIDELRN